MGNEIKTKLKYKLSETNDSLKIEFKKKKLFLWIERFVLFCFFIISFYLVCIGLHLTGSLTPNLENVIFSPNGVVIGLASFG